MAITTKQIMEMYRAENNIPNEVELFTFAAWKERGYTVRKGEHAKHKVNLWKYRERENKDGMKNGYCIHRTMNLFTREQVEPIV